MGDQCYVSYYTSRSPSTIQPPKTQIDFNEKYPETKRYPHKILVLETAPANGLELAQPRFLLISHQNIFCRHW